MNNPENIPDDIDIAISQFGHRIFEAIGKQRPSTFNPDYWSGKIMEWSMENPEFKVNMFRLVDVLPSLNKKSSVAKHVTEYLGKAGSKIHKLLDWGLNVRPGSIRGTITALAVQRAVHQMARQFIAGETAKDALGVLHDLRKNQIAFTVDLLGEYSLSEKEAEAYLNRYLNAIQVIGTTAATWKTAKPIIPEHPGETYPASVSIKLSALYSQCSSLNHKKSVEVLSERLLHLTSEAKKHRVLIYIDAEDTAHNEIIYDVFHQVFLHSEFCDFPYPGAVVQAYLKNSERVIDQLLEMARKRGKSIAIRLVKGAYWDSEIAQSRENGWPNTVFEEKYQTDAHYEYLSEKLLKNIDLCLPAFGSHNIRSLAHACCTAEHYGVSKKQFELQMLYGMAEPIAKAFTAKEYLVRMYVPLGKMIPGMGYLVRRLLENTANESFLRHTFFDAEHIDELLSNPALKNGNFSEQS